MKKFLSFFLAVLMIIAIIPITTVPTLAATTTSDSIAQRIDVLISQLSGKYFTVNGTACQNGGKCSTYTCCHNISTMKQDWFKNLFDGVDFSTLFPTSASYKHYYPSNNKGAPSGSQGGWSCHGFGTFAFWYIFGYNRNTVTPFGMEYVVTTTEESSAGFNAETIDKYAKPGDIMRFGSHTVILISSDSKGVTVLDCNWGRKCKIQKHYMPYEQVWNKDTENEVCYYNDPIGITRASNYDEIANGGNTSTEDNNFTGDTSIEIPSNFSFYNGVKTGVDVKIANLVKWFDYKYFTTEQGEGTCAGEHCEECYNVNIVKSEWMVDLLGTTISPSQFPWQFYPSDTTSPIGSQGGYNDHGFAIFALWYIFAPSVSSTVTAEYVITHANNDTAHFNYETLSEYARPGDLIRIHPAGANNSVGHSVILVSLDSEGATVVDCNYLFDDDGYNRVRKHKILFSDISSFGCAWESCEIAITRASNYDAISNSTSLPLSKVQYRYHRYKDSSNSTTPISVCGYYLNSNYGSLAANIVREETAWLDERLPIDTTTWNYYQHGKSSSCPSFNCTDETVAYMYKHTKDGESWYYEEMRFVPIEFAVTFDANGGTTPTASKSVIYGSTYGTLPTPTRAGYTFNGWYTAKTGGTKITSTSTVSLTAAQTLYAQWTANTYTITFNANGGTTPTASKSVTYGSTYGTLPTPTRTGYTFNGWYTAKTGGTKITSTSTVSITAAQILYAQWTANTYTVTFNANGGVVLLTNKTVTYGSTYGTLPDPDRPGYIFAGWYTAASGGTKITSDTAVSITANQTLYAHWTARTYTITYDANGGTNAPAAQTKTYDVVLTLTTDIPTRTGYTFKGWALSATRTDVSYAPGGNFSTNEDTTLYAVWSTNTYTIFFDPNGGAGTNAQTKTHNVDLTLSSTIPERTGYTFKGWSTSPTGAVEYASGATYSTNASVTLYAVWAANTYTVTFNANGGTTSTASKSITYDSAYGTLPTPTRTGYIFDGWYTAAEGGTEITSSTEVSTTGNRILYAHWVQNTYTVTFNANSGTTPTASKSVTYGSTYGTLPTPTRTGYTFNGWYTAKTGGTKITSTSTVSITAAQTLYAQWTANTYTVTFDANGGTGAPAEQTKTHDVALTLSSTKPTRTGYNFMGWATTASGTVVYAPGASFTTNSDTTLYAVWEVATVSVTGVTLNKTTATLTEGDTLTLTATVAPSNATNKNVTWKSSDTSIATVSSSGVVIALKAGTVTITVTTVDGNKTATCAVTVKAKTVSVTGVTLSNTSATLAVGDTLTLTATVAPSNATNKNVTWRSSDASVATVSSSGVVTALEVGEATITVITADGSKTASCTVTVAATTYTITYDANGGRNAPAAQDKEHDVSLDLSNSTPIREGYAFRGWSTTANGEVEYTVGSRFTENQDTTLYAVWVKTPSSNFTISVEFGEIKSDNTIDVDVIIKNNPGIWGYEFTLEFDENILTLVDYDADEEGNIKSDFPTEPTTNFQEPGKVLEDLSWVRVNSARSNSWDDDGMLISLTFRIDDMEALKEGTDFIFEDIVFASRYIEEFPLAIENRTLIIPETVTVSFDTNGGTVSTASKTVTFGSTYGTLPTPTRTGYTFNGWYTAAEGGKQITSTSIASTTTDQILYAHWTAKTYTVTFNANGGTTSTSSKTVTYDSIYGTLPTPTRTGYTFDGWYTAAKDGTKITSDTTVSITAAKTLYAHWTPNTYTVTFVALDQTTPSSNKTVTYDATYGSLPTLTRTGFTFNGWYTAAEGGTKITSESIVSIAADHTLYAQWTRHTYTVTFDANGGTTPVASITVEYGLEYGEFPIPTRDGYSFSGWYVILENGVWMEVVSEQPSNIFVVGDHTLYAQWTPNTYTVNYNANGGTGAPVAQTKTHDVALTLSAAKPTRTGYNFMGWATTANGAVVYAPGASFTTNSDTTLYAVWEVATVPVTGVTLNKTTATLTEGDTLTLTATVAPTNATNKNVTWKSSDTSVATVSSLGVVTALKAGSTTITATTEDGSKTASCKVTVKAAYDPNALTFTLDSVKAVAGKTVTVDLVISNNTGFAGASLEVEYDSSVMTLTGYESGSWEATSNFDEDPANNPVAFSWARTKNYTANTTFLSLTFEIKEDAPAGDYAITLSSEFGVFDQDQAGVNFNLVDGKITVADCEPGDTNGDGTINAADAVLLAQYLAKWSVEMDLDAADTNGDGTVNAADAVLLAQYLAKWDVTLG